MTEVSNDLPDVANFLFSQSPMDECLTYENVIQAPDDFFDEPLAPSVVEEVEADQTFQLIGDGLSNYPRISIADNSTSLSSTITSMINSQTVYPHVATSCQSPSQALGQDSGLNHQVSQSNSVYNINATQLPNELGYQNLSSMVSSA